MTGLWTLAGATIGAVLTVGMGAFQGRLVPFDELAFGAVALGMTGLYGGAVFSTALSLTFRGPQTRLTSTAPWVALGALAGAAGYVTALIMNGVPLGQLLLALRSGAAPFLAIMALGGAGAGLAVARAVADRPAIDSSERARIGRGGES